MKIIEQKVPFLIFDVDSHAQIKPSIVAAIEGMGSYSYINNLQHITHTDWHLGSNFYRPYYELVAPIINDVMAKVNDFYKYPEPLSLINYWFQKYLKNDHHSWHIHERSIFNAVYFLSLPEGASETSLKLLEEEFTVGVKEGQVLVFPSMYLHCSKPNTSDDPKLVIAFNL
jgi:hypothetical protein